MTEQELATCHCIIGHPHNAKFLAIKHQTGWTVPTLKFPQGPVDFRAAMITAGMQRKYGLNTRVLRSLVSTSRYHCIELELPQGGSSKKLAAVWVDREQYQKFRSERNVPLDPFDQWLQEREQGIVPALRSAWQIPGWFKQADHWIHFQAEKLGLQVTGSVQQFRVGWNASCLLRVPTSAGMLFFKAGYAKPPGEAALTMALADKWPEYVVLPLAVDRARNWLLNRDLNQAGNVSPDLALLPQFARALATIQVGSIDCKADWKALGCPVHDLDYLLSSIEHRDELLPHLLEGPDRLNEMEVEQTGLALAAHADTCRLLLEFDIPATLVHTDFRDDNLVLQDGGLRIINWSDVVVGHPFMALKYINSRRASLPSEDTKYSPRNTVSEALFSEIISAYLKEFLAFAPMEKLEQAWALTRSLFPMWNLFRVYRELSWAEKDSPRYTILVAQLQRAARELVATAGEN